jgi:hypothetical protein
MASPGPSLASAGSGRWMIPFIRTVDAATEQKYPVLLEYAKASFERIKHSRGSATRGRGGDRALRVKGTRRANQMTAVLFPLPSNLTSENVSSLV